MESYVRWAFRRSTRTTPDTNSSLGWVTITHPFHPLCQQQFSVLKRRRVSGVQTLIIRHPDRGSFAVAEEWTDWGQPSTAGDAEFQNTLLEFESLPELAGLVKQLAKTDGVDE